MVIYKDNGEEVTGNIVKEEAFIVDVFRLGKASNNHEGIPSNLGIICMEDLTLFTTSFNIFTRILERNLVMNIVVRKFMSKRLFDLTQRQISFLTGGAKERYTFILEQNPNLLKNWPLRFIASMIGITPTQLSRIRSEK
ncbi:MAG: hypothetical protein CL842_03565 [Crocinitomicaceae bacterium]|nr:hypothetical protein [Crocinitomicaceae bacterium]|tara:strand:- start:386 stop:802 length:417 start_codon:yes stop_codon:yes gene_type:complete